MIVRDEAAIIERCLSSVLDLVDTWVICDTGSRDTTPSIVEHVLDSMPGALHHTTWVDFGHNRSELMRLAQGSAEYLLLLDADMTIEQRAPLPDLACDAYVLRESGALDFGILRLVRGDRYWWYEGATHEYLCTDGQFEQEEIDAWSVRHHGDGSSREGKLLRDLGLLKRAVAGSEPSRRSAFYLAQTYRDLGRRTPAITWYRKRVELGGWEEEVFYANLQEGILRLEDGVESAAGVLLEAWQRRPSRAEPLYYLARAYREQGDLTVAHLFAHKGLEISYSADLLFVHRWIYEWGLRLEHAVAAGRLGRRGEALDDLRILVDGPPLPEHVQTFVAGQLDELEERPTAGPGTGARRASRGPRRLGTLASSLRIGELKLDVRPSWPVFNPSITADGDGFRMIARTANYRINDGVVHDDGMLRNINYLLHLDRDLAVSSIEPLDDSTDVLRYPSRIHGYEDCRLIEVGGEWFASATVCELNPIERREIALLSIEGSTVTRVGALDGPQPGRHEKNWMPFVVDGVLHFVYSCSPTVILRCESATWDITLVRRSATSESMAGLRGGSQGVPLGDGSFLFAVHEVDRTGERPIYVHRFVHLAEDGHFDGMTEPFTFTSDPVEFCGGMAKHEGGLVLSFGVSDAAAGLAVLDLREVRELLVPLETKKMGVLQR
jgi:glycosyltransferase involved in cell wall biosynthesis